MTSVYYRWKVNCFPYGKCRVIFYKWTISEEKENTKKIYIYKITDTWVYAYITIF